MPGRISGTVVVILNFSEGGTDKVHLSEVKAWGCQMGAFGLGPCELSCVCSNNSASLGMSEASDARLSDEDPAEESEGVEA